ncbi:MAG: FlgD immunoglobulin-like domain containing protein [Candidatus Krumholzibacteriia bacterium]|nr:hypothetical protein [Candidatus Latescibacterota bacterium]
MPQRIPARSTFGLGLALAFAALLLGMGATTAQAWDYTELTVIDAVMVDGNPAVTLGQGFSVRVRTMNGDGSVDTSVNALLFELYTTHAATLPPDRYIVNGEVQFDNVVFNAPGTGIQLEARAVDDITAPKGYEWINCYPFVDHFNISLPSGDKWVGQNIPITLIAVDEFGVPIGNFADDVTLAAQIGHLGPGPTQLVSGGSFDHGQASVNVQFLGTDPLTRSNVVTATGGRIYPGQSSYPRGTAVVTPLWPAALDGIVLVLPGETLTPGVPPGKSGTPTHQLAGIPFAATVYAVDAWWNPVLESDPGLPFTLSYSCSDGHPQVQLPPGGAMSGNTLSDQYFRLITAATHSVSATASGSISDVSNSYLTVDPQNLDHFEFNYAIWDTLDVQVTTQPFNVEITARDFYENRFPYNGAVSLRVRYGAEESEDYILSSTSTFVAGQLDTDIQVTRRFFSCALVCDSGGSASSTSGSFQVNPGPLASFLVTLPGQTYAPGLSTPGFSGNLGTPNPTTAGLTVSPVVVRPVDEYFNMVGGTHFVGASSGDGYFQLPAFADNNFTVSNATNIDVIYRTFGSRTLTITSSQGVSGTSDAIQVSPAAYARLAVVAPGETLAPGIFDSIEEDGKLGDSNHQDAGIAFPVTVVATDAFWNPVGESDPSLPISLRFTSSDGAASLPSPGQLLSASSGNFNVTLRTLADPNFQTVHAEDMNGSAEAFTAVPLQAGVIDHFTLGVNSRTNPTPNDPLDPIPDFVAGQVLSDLTIVARDQFGNHIPTYGGTGLLTVSHGDGILAPMSVDFSDGGTWPGAELGVWRGGLQVFKAGSDVTLTVTDAAYARTGVSNAFDVLAGAYSDLLLILPGEMHTPGIGSGKAGVPFPVDAGETLSATLLAVDAFFNQVATQPSVQLSSTGYSVVTTANPVVLQPNGSASSELYFRTAGDQDLAIADVTWPDRADTSTVEIAPGPFTRLQIIAPGETPNPGGYESDGKLGTPDLQTTSLQFDIEVRSVDEYWNQVPNNDEHVLLTSSDGALDDINPPNQGQNLSGGSLTLPIFLIASGAVSVEVNPLDNLDILPQAVTISLQQGAQYLIATPDSARVGPPQTFGMTVSLVDSLGMPETAANNTVDITAFKSNLDPASSTLWVGQATLSAGVVTIPAQAYNTVEDIIIRVSDDAGRLAYSQPIHMLSNGREYRIALGQGANPVAGPPSTFPIAVEMRDVDTGTRIDVDRDLDVSVWASATGAPGLGMVGVTEASLESGYVLFNQSYSRAENVYVHVEDDQGLTGNSAIFTVTADGYKRLQILAPGEEVRPGVEAFAETGKEGVPDTQRSRIPFPVTVRAVDQFWNLVSTVNEGAIMFSSTDNSVGPGNPPAMGSPYVNGRRTFQLYLDAQGTVDLSAWDDDNTAPPGQTVSIPVTPGYEYQITLSNPAPQTGYPGFQMIVEMIDPVTGDPAPDANHSFGITALNPDFSVAAGNLAITDETLAAGVRVINGQQYDRVEPIILRVMDDVGRVGYTDIVDMQPGGLVYEVSVPDTATVGGPTSFPVTVRLLDLGTGLVVASQDTTFAVDVYSGQTGQLGAGSWSVGSNVLNDGRCSFNETYTGAGNIYLRVHDERGVVGISDTIVMLPDGYKRLQLIAPGETPVPGVSSQTGKTGNPILQQAEVPFMVQVRATDQYWNLIETFNAGAVTLSSSEGSVRDGNPPNNGAPLIGGIGDYALVIHNQGSIIVFAQDTENPEVLAHSVNIPVGEAQYEISVPAIAQAGPPASWPMTIRLVRDDGTLITAANDEVYLTALLPNHETALDQLGVTSGVLAAGELSIGGQTYATVQDIVIRVTDDQGRESFSDVIHMVPEDVTYRVTTPVTATVGPPASFTVDLELIDTSTGQRVTSDDRSFTVEAVNHNTGDLGAGVLALTAGSTHAGLCTLTESYTAAEPIYLRITDEQGVVVFTDPIQVHHGPPQNLSVTADLSTLEVGQATAITAALTDLFGNNVLSEPVAFTLLSGDGVLTADSVLTGNLGTASNVVRVPTGGREDLVVQVSVRDLPTRLVEIAVIGPPLTELSLLGTNAETSHGVMVTPETRFALSSSSEIGLYRTYWGVDLGPEALPQNLYFEPLSFEDLGIGAYGQHTLSYYADDIKGNRENVQTFTVVFGADLAADHPVSNRPNPFQAGREETVILFRAAADGTAVVRIHDHFGNLVWTHELGTQNGQTYQVPWDGRNGRGEIVGNGGYLCTVRTGGELLRRKIAVVK